MSEGMKFGRNVGAFVGFLAGIVECFIIIPDILNCVLIVLFSTVFFGAIGSSAAKFLNKW